MTTYNKTLADARPGGRVRLGDQAERARFEAWHCEKFKTRWLTGAPTRDMHNGVYAENYGPAEQQARWELWQAAWKSALSTQPSPGGQGDSRSEKAATFLRQYLTYLRSSPRQGLRPRWCDVYEALEVAIEALAASQPVDAGDLGMPLHERVVATMRSAGFDAEEMTFVVESIINQQNSAVEAFAAPPEQAVDLPYSLDADPAGIRARVADVITGTLMVGAQGHTPPPTGHWAEPFWQAARADATAQAVDLGPRPMNTAPQDGTMVRLLVNFEENATEDTAGTAWTIGACNDDNVGDDEKIGWQFAGWCWTHDHFTEGKGTPIGWLPLIDSQAVGK